MKSLLCRLASAMLLAGIVYSPTANAADIDVVLGVGPILYTRGTYCSLFENGSSNNTDNRLNLLTYNINQTIGTLRLIAAGNVQLKANGRAGWNEIGTLGINGTAEGIRGGNAADCTAAFEAAKGAAVTIEQCSLEGSNEGQCQRKINFTWVLNNEVRQSASHLSGEWAKPPSGWQCNASRTCVPIASVAPKPPATSQSAGSAADTASNWGILGTWQGTCGRTATTFDPAYTFSIRGGQLQWERHFGGGTLDTLIIRSAMQTPDGALQLTFDFTSPKVRWEETWVKASDGRIRVVSSRNIDTNVYSTTAGQITGTPKVTPWFTRCAPGQPTTTQPSSSASDTAGKSPAATSYVLPPPPRPDEQCLAYIERVRPELGISNQSTAAIFVANVQVGRLSNLVFYQLGNGNTFANAKVAGATAAQPGDILAFGTGQGIGADGHVALITAVDGSNITVSQGNFDASAPDGSYTFKLGGSKNSEKQIVGIIRAVK